MAGILPSDLSLVAFGSGLVAALWIYLLLTVSIVTDRQWWPPGDRSWSYYAHWISVGVFNVSAVLVAALEWNTWLLPRPASLVVGGGLVAIGGGIFVRSANVMESAEVTGVDGDLYTSGPYAYSRNPQYVGMLVGLTGFALLVDSALVTVLVGVHAGWVLLLPRAEEPHLRSMFGDEYDRYVAHVPRFIDTRTVRLLLSDRRSDQTGG